MLNVWETSGYESILIYFYFCRLNVWETSEYESIQKFLKVFISTIHVTINVGENFTMTVLSSLCLYLPAISPVVLLMLSEVAFHHCLLFYS